MKKVILIISIFTVLIQSCSTFNYGNFNKQKFTSLKTRAVKFKETKIVDKPIVIDKLSSTKINKIKQKINKNVIDTTFSYRETIAKKEVVINKSKEKTTTQKLVRTKKGHISSENKNSIKTISIITKGKINGLFFFLILLGFPLMFIKRTGYKISKWAKTNVKKAQILIGVYTVTGLGSSYLLGNVFDFNISKFMFVAPVVLGVGSLVLNKIKTKRQFVKNKLAISMLSTSSLFMSFSVGSNASFHLLDSSREMVVHPILAVILTILVIALLALSIYGLAALACTIYCGGAELLAGIIFFGGSGGFIFLAVLAIIKLFRKKDEYKKIKKSMEKRKKDINTILLSVALALLTLTVIMQ